MKKKFLLLGSLLIGLIILNLTQFSTNWEMLSILVPNFRLPRLIILLAAGVSLSISGLIIQTVTENPLADSSTIGITSGASAGAVIFLLLSNHLHLSGNWNFAYPFFAFAGAILSFILIYLLALRKNASNIRILLTGIAITALFQSIITIAQLSINQFDFQQVAVWLTGEVWQTDSSYLISVLSLLLITLIMLPLFIKPMEVLSLGENLATNLGLHVRKTKIGLYILALVFAAIGVLLVGGLSFIGLIAPHIARELAGFKLKNRVAMTLLTSMIILVFADIISQTIIAPSSLPLGFVVAFIGAPYYIYLIQKI